MKYNRRRAGNGRLLSSVCIGCLFCILWSCGYCVTASAKTAEAAGTAETAGTAEAAGTVEKVKPTEMVNPEDIQRVILGPELYDSRAEIPEPEEEVVDETGRIYKLSAWEAETVPVTDRREPVSGEILYEGVMRDAGLPEEAEFQVKDERSGKMVTAMLPLAETEYTNERWEDELCFTATFHQYGADGYYLGEREIRSLEKEDPSPFGAELLELIGLDPDSSRVESWEWAGEPYTDEEGTLCRDASVYGTLLVYDCRAIYRGQAELPDYNRFRVNAVYKLQKEKPEEESRENWSASDSEIHTAEPSPPGEQKTKNRFWEKLVRAVKTCLKLTVALFLLILLILGFRFLLRAAGKLCRKWRDTDEREE